MRLTSVITGLILVAARTTSVWAAHDVDVSIQWPESNPFGRVVNGGSSNQLNVRLSNHAGQDIIVTRVFGAWREPHGKERPLRNTTTLALKQPIASGQKSPLIPYRFHSENKIGEVGLRVWVEYLDQQSKPHITLGFEGAATVVEPQGSWFDPALLFSYLVVLAALGGIGYLLYGVYLAPAPTKTKAKRVKREVVEQDTTPVAPDANEWIPAHHLKTRKGYQSATSGDESESGKQRTQKKRGGRR